MKNPLRQRTIAVVGAAVALAFTSCAYDPYYSAAGGYYSSGYGDGYGYGSSNFSTSYFVSTGDPYWGYDPYCYSYYDYRRNCYYDPYLNGYYPRGYRPAVIVGCPHPYGWRPGSGYCPPPRHVRNVTMANYRNREAAYRNSNYGWAQQVRQQPISQVRGQHQRLEGNRYNRPASGAQAPMNYSTTGRPASGSRPPATTSSRQIQGQNPYSKGMKPASYAPDGGRPPAVTNKSTRNLSQRQYHPGSNPPQIQSSERPLPPPASRKSFQPGTQPGYPQNPQPRGKGGDLHRQNDSKPAKNKEDQRGLRGLGEG